MLIYLEPQFDCIIEIDGKIFECNENTPLQILPNDNVSVNSNKFDAPFLVRFYPKNTEHNITYACLIKPANDKILCDCPLIKIDKLDTSFLIRALACETILGIFTYGSLQFIKTATTLKVLNTRTGALLLNSHCNYHEFDKEKGTLTLFKHHSNIFNCGYIERYALISENKLVLKEGFCACKDKRADSKADAETAPHVAYNDVPIAFFEAAKAGYYSVAQNFLNEELAKKLNSDYIKQFFESYYKISKNIYLGNGYFLHPFEAVAKLALVKFELDSFGKIANIIEM